MNILIMKKLYILLLFVFLIINITACKGNTSNNESTQSQELYVDTLQSTVKIWANAYYKNNPDDYLKYSTNNAECKAILGVTDYDFEKQYSLTKSELSDYKAYMDEQYDFYYVEAEPSNYEIYDKSSEIFSKYIENVSKTYSNTDVIDAFALVEIQILLEQASGSSAQRETQTSNIECMLIGDTWYVMV